MADPQDEASDHPGAQAYAALRQAVLAHQARALEDVTQMAFVSMWKTATLAGVSNSDFEKVLLQEPNPLLAPVYNLALSRLMLKKIPATDIHIRDFAKQVDEKNTTAVKALLRRELEINSDAAENITVSVAKIIDRQVAAVIAQGRAG
jgi:hypothetical protein